MTEEITEENREVWLHYVGSGTYGIKKYVAEADKLGVSRAIPFSVLKKMKWGDIVYLAEFKRDNRRVEKSAGMATIFGYVTVGGFNHTLPAEIREQVKKEIPMKCESWEGALVNRECGSYEITSLCYTEEKLEAIANIIEKLLKESNLDPNDYNFLVTGKFSKLDKEVRVPLYFFRGFTKFPATTLKTWVEGKAPDVAEIRALKGYSRRHSKIGRLEVA